MKLESTRQLSEKELRRSVFDLVICASGYERRASHFAEKFSSLKVRRKVAFGFSDRKMLSREYNDSQFRSFGFELIEADGNDASPIIKLISAEIRRPAKSPLRVLLDYSCMTRVWYASLIHFLSLSPHSGTVEVVFSYTPSSFTTPGNISANKFMGPIAGFCQLGLPTRDTALVVGLGYEKERALGLVDYVEPKETYAMYTNPALESKFLRQVQKNNSELLARLKNAGPGYVIPHPLNDMEITMTLLAGLCSRLAGKFRVILAPLGVKPFSLLCLLLAAGWQSVDVWRVSGGLHADPIDRAPLGPTLLFSACFSNVGKRTL